eukprot:TRINITY_DN11975_c0_g1_i1.p1 TRINITY_DN11975_c0_g1~~TRINITY_DN11975_c0_g1_i1.p1  ORF type:complete len:419 (-),score=77.49 TRINITY_DN11975_c0_g1_i1:359-1615(-)
MPRHRRPEPPRKRHEASRAANPDFLRALEASRVAQATQASSESTTVLQTPQELPGFIFDASRNRYFSVSQYHPIAHSTQESCAPSLSSVKRPSLFASITARELGSVSRGQFARRVEVGTLQQSRSQLRFAITHCADMSVISDAGLETIAVACGSSYCHIDAFGAKIVYPTRTPCSAIRWHWRGLATAAVTMGDAALSGQLVVRMMSGAEIVMSAPRSTMWSCDWNPAKMEVAVGTSKKLRIADIDQHKWLVVGRFRTDALAVQFLDNGRTLLSVCLGGRDGLIRIYDTRAQGESYMKQTSSVHWLQPLPDDANYLLAASLDNVIHLWDRRRLRSVQLYRGHRNSSELVRGAVSRSGRVFALGGDDRRVRLWSVDTPECVHVSDVGGSVVRALAPAEDTRSWLACDEEGVKVISIDVAT